MPGLKTTTGSLETFGPEWAGCRIMGSRLILDNGEAYEISELRYLRWERNQYKRLSRVLQSDLARSGQEGAVVFSIDELSNIRAALRLLDDKLPGFKIQAADRRGKKARA